jgi:ATP-binding cassette, subfamily B, bacterial HlyB/CyaB
VKVVVPQEFKTQICEAFGEVFTAKDLAFWIKSMKQIEPTAGQMLWDTSEPPENLYIVLSGKVRLADSQGDLILSVESGSVVGERFLFAEADLQPYSVRASQGAKLGCLSQDALLRMMKTYPQIRERLYAQALQRDLLSLFIKHSIFRDLSRSQLQEILHETQLEALCSITLFLSHSPR